MHRFSIFDAGTPEPCPSEFNAAHYVLAAADDLPDKPALEVYQSLDTAPEVWTFRDLRHAALATAGGLQAKGVRRGDRIVLRIGNSADFPILFLGALCLGAIPVPTSPALTEPEIHIIVQELSPKLLCIGKDLMLSGDGLPEVLRPEDFAVLQTHAPLPPVTCKPDDLAYMIYTSGTSGAPRAVMHAHRAVWARRMMQTGWTGLLKSDRLLHAGAFNWTYTLGTGLLDPWSVGATSLIYTGPPDRTVWPTLCRAHKPTIFAAAPGVYRQMLQEDPGASFTSLRHGLSAGEKLPDATRAKWHRATGLPLYEAFGMSEVSTFVSSGPDVPHKPGTTGRPQPGRSVAVIGDDGPVPIGKPGILAVSAADQGLMLGYYAKPNETRAKHHENWFLTGDTVAMDENGYISYLGRDDDMMNAGGYRVSPLEVETALLDFDGVSEVAAIEVEVKQDVKVIAAFYVADHDIDADMLTAHCADRLAHYKCPRLFTRLDTLPKGANNKLKRKDLRALQQRSFDAKT